MLRVWSDILMAADRRQVTLLSLLDMSAAFDCVDHAILLQRLRFAVGLSDVVLDWIESFVWPHAADRLWWPTVSDAARSVRRSTRLRIGTAIVRVHIGTSAHRRQTWPLAALVCRRSLTSLRQHDGRRRSTCS